MAAITRRHAEVRMLHAHKSTQSANPERQCIPWLSKIRTRSQKKKRMSLVRKKVSRNVFAQATLYTASTFGVCLAIDCYHNPGCYLCHIEARRTQRMGIIQVAALRRDGARRWELAATQTVHTVQVRCTVLCAVSCCFIAVSLQGLLTA